MIRKLNAIAKLALKVLEAEVI